MKLTRPMFLAAGLSAAALCAAVAMVPVAGLKPEPGIQVRLAGSDRDGMIVRLDYADVAAAEWTAIRARGWMASARKQMSGWLQPPEFIQIRAAYADAACVLAAGLILFGLPWQLRRQRQWELRSLRRIAEQLRTRDATADPL